MKILINKRGKKIIAVFAFILIALFGLGLERYKSDMFIEETVATEDAVLFEEDTGENTGLVNINTADEEELASLYGIGDSLAARIVDYREKNGRYETVEEIMKVPGINEKKFEDIKDYIMTK